MLVRIKIVLKFRVASKNKEYLVSGLYFKILNLLLLNLVAYSLLNVAKNSVIVK